MSNILSDRKYSASHEWVKVEGGIAVVGITDHAQQELGDITYVDLPDVGKRVTAGEACGALESVKASSEVYTPVSGELVEVNEALSSAPEEVNAAPYAAWLFKVRMVAPSELDALMDEAAYAQSLGE